MRKKQQTKAMVICKNGKISFNKQGQPVFILTLQIHTKIKALITSQGLNPLPSPPALKTKSIVCFYTCTYAGIHTRSLLDSYVYTDVQRMHIAITCNASSGLHTSVSCIRMHGNKNVGVCIQCTWTLAYAYKRDYTSSLMHLPPICS